MRLSVGYPSYADERTLMVNLRREHPILSLHQVQDVNRLPILQRQAWEVHVDDSLQDYILRLVSATRVHPDLALGGSPRASLALYKTAQALAAMRGRDHVIPDDIKYLVPFTLAHRLIVKPEAELRNRTGQLILDEILSSTELDIGKLA
jgi:MoxR-like ATPase